VELVSVRTSESPPERREDSGGGGAGRGPCSALLTAQLLHCRVPMPSSSTAGLASACPLGSSSVIQRHVLCPVAACPRSASGCHGRVPVPGAEDDATAGAMTPLTLRLAVTGPGV